MPTKYEIAEYLVNLHTLLDAQQRTVTLPSTTIAEEYNRQWAVLKDLINQEQSNETRSVDQPPGRSEAGADLFGNQSRRRIADRDQGSESST